MKTKCILLVVLMMLVALPAVSFAVDSCTQTWQIGSSMATARYRTQGAVVDGVFYVFGGMDGLGGYYNAVEAYDYWTDTWTPRAAMPSPASNYCVATWDDLIYIIGGYDDTCHTYFYAYDTATDTWDTSLSQLSEKSCGAACAALNGKVFAAGGNDGTVTQDDLNIYDIATDTWSAGSAMPAAVAFAHGGIINDDFIVAGGYPSLTSTYVYDIATNNWTTTDSMILGRQSGAIANVQTPSGMDGLFIMGGGSTWTPTDDVQEFVTTWNVYTGKELPGDRLAQAGGNIGGAVLFSAGGGSNPGVPVKDLYIYNLCCCHIHSADPAFAPAGVATVIDFFGIHFDDLTEFWLEDSAKATYPLTSVSVSSTSEAQATVPTNAPAGYYKLWGSNFGPVPQFYGMIEFELCDCVISDVCYDDGDQNPTNECEICDPATTAIAWTSNEGETCDDGLWCTENDLCAAGACEGAPRDCDDGAFCTGVETCNDDTDACDSPGDPCTANETCNEDTDVCDAADDDDDDDDDDAAGGDDDDDDGGCCG